MVSVQYDLIYLKAGIAELKDFLLADDLFWPVGVNPPSEEPPYPQLTMGGLLLARRRINGRQLPVDQETQITKLLREMESIASDWKVAWSRKAAREFQMRLNMWRNFVEEYRKDPDGNADRYPYEIRLRVMLHLLKSEAEELNSAELEMLAGLDSLLKEMFVPGEFVWDETVKEGFPSEVYWYLYGELHEESRY